MSTPLVIPSPHDMFMFDLEINGEKTQHILRVVEVTKTHVTYMLDESRHVYFITHAVWAENTSGLSLVVTE